MPLTRSVSEIQSWLVSKLSEILDLPSDQIDVREPFASYGLDSANAVALSGDLEDWLGGRLSATLVYEYPSIEALSRYLSSGAPETLAQGGWK